MGTTSRSRWAAVGAAVAVTLGAGAVGLVAATSPSGASAYVPINPCRAADTRPAPDVNIGSRTTPLGAAETHTVNSNDGDCAGDVPVTATGLQLNVTAVGATTTTFLTTWSEGPRPNASSLNPTAGAPPAPNAVTTSITASGDFNIYNDAGSVHVIVDVVGFYTDHDHDDRYYTKDETALTMFARAQSDGTLIAGTDGVSVTKQLGDGRYVVRFPIDVTDCALVAQNNVNNADVASELVYLYTSTPDDPNDVFVYFEDEAGAPDDREFSVIVTC